VHQVGDQPRLFFESLSRKLNFIRNMTRITDTLHEKQYTFLIISGSFLRMRNVSDKRFRENQNTDFIFSNFFLEVIFFLENVEKYCTAGQATDDHVAGGHCMLDT